jgi:hypothetical protein
VPADDEACLATGPDTKSVTMHKVAYGDLECLERGRGRAVAGITAGGRYTKWRVVRRIPGQIGRQKHRPPSSLVTRVTECAGDQDLSRTFPTTTRDNRLGRRGSYGASGSWLSLIVFLQWGLARRMERHAPTSRPGAFCTAGHCRYETSAFDSQILICG